MVWVNFILNFNSLVKKNGFIALYCDVKSSCDFSLSIFWKISFRRIDSHIDMCYSINYSNERIYNGEWPKPFTFVQIKSIVMPPLKQWQEHRYFVVSIVEQTFKWVENETKRIVTRFSHWICVSIFNDRLRRFAHINFLIKGGFMKNRQNLEWPHTNLHLNCNNGTE